MVCVPGTPSSFPLASTSRYSTKPVLWTCVKSRGNIEEGKSIESNGRKECEGRYIHKYIYTWKEKGGVIDNNNDDQRDD